MCVFSLLMGIYSVANEHASLIVFISRDLSTPILGYIFPLLWLFFLRLGVFFFLLFTGHFLRIVSVSGRPDPTRPVSVEELLIRPVKF